MHELFFVAPSLCVTGTDSARPLGVSTLSSSQKGGVSGRRELVPSTTEGETLPSRNTLYFACVIFGRPPIHDPLSRCPTGSRF